MCIAAACRLSILQDELILISWYPDGQDAGIYLLALGVSFNSFNLTCTTATNHGRRACSVGHSYLTRAAGIVQARRSLCWASSAGNSRDAFFKAVTRWHVHMTSDAIFRQASQSASGHGISRPSILLIRGLAPVSTAITSTTESQLIE